MRIKAKKGCINPECKNNQKVLFNKDEHTCPDCGEALFFVCSKCYTVLEGGSEKLCLRHQAESKDKKDEVAGIIGKVIAVATGVAAVVPVVISTVLNLKKDDE